MLIFIVRKLIQFTFTPTVYESDHFIIAFSSREKSFFHFANHYSFIFSFYLLTTFTHFSHIILLIYISWLLEGLTNFSSVYNHLKLPFMFFSIFLVRCLPFSNRSLKLFWLLWYSTEQERHKPYLHGQDSLLSSYDHVEHTLEVWKFKFLGTS